MGRSCVTIWRCGVSGWGRLCWECGNITEMGYCAADAVRACGLLSILLIFDIALSQVACFGNFLLWWYGLLATSDNAGHKSFPWRWPCPKLNQWQLNSENLEWLCTEQSFSRGAFAWVFTKGPQLIILLLTDSCPRRFWRSQKLIFKSPALLKSSFQ